MTTLRVETTESSPDMHFWPTRNVFCVFFEMESKILLAFLAPGEKHAGLQDLEAENNEKACS